MSVNLKVLNGHIAMGLNSLYMAVDGLNVDSHPSMDIYTHAFQP